MLFKNNFNGGTAGQVISTANSGGTSGTAFTFAGSTQTYTTNHATGGRSPLVAQIPADGYLNWDISAAAWTVYTRYYLYLTAYPTSASKVHKVAYGIDDNASHRLNTNGTLVVLAGQANTVVSSTTTSALPLNQWVRIEFYVQVQSGSCELRIYHSADSAVATQTLTGTANFQNTIQPAYIYVQGVPGTTIFVDDLGFSDTTWLGTERLDTEVTPAALTASSSLFSPAISTGSGITPDQIIGAGSILEPEVFTASNTTQAEPAQVQAIWDLLPPVVEAFRNVTVEPQIVVASANAIDPVVTVPYNPGDRITTSGQVEWNGFLLGSDTPYRIQQIDGWITDMPTLDSGNVTHPSRHGAYPGRKLAQERQVTLTCLVRSSRDSIAQDVRDLIAISPIMEDDTELPLAIRVLDTTYIGYGSVIRRSIPIDKYYRLGHGRLTIQWSMSNPLLLSRELQSAVVGDGEFQTVANIGNAATYPTIRVIGPATNPSFAVQNNLGQERVLEFGLDVPAGDVLIIDTYYGTATIGDTHVISSLSGSSVPIPDFVLASGNSVISYSTSSGNASAATVLWRHAYL